MKAEADLRRGAGDAGAATPWPGNVRELRNVIERLVILSEESIDVGDLPEEIVAEVARSQREASAAASELPRVELPAEARALPLREFRDHIEREYIRIKLDENDWNISRTATLLGHRAHQPAQEDARARPVARQPGSRQPGPVRRRREPRRCSRIAGTLGFSAVLLGAFGAHGLRDRLAPPMLEIYRTGVLYHLVHAVAVLAVALGRRSPAPPAPGRRPVHGGDRDLLRHALPAGDHRA